MAGRRKEKKTLIFALAGNPNSGKTTIFNAMTGAHQHVGNWPGVTVEKKEGHFFHGDYRITVIDLPGTYSLSAYSLEEIIARNFLIGGRPDVVIHVVDASNLERNLFLTTQLIEMSRPVVLALNVYDEMEHSGARIDVDRLSASLGTPAVPTVGTRGKGISDLIETSIRVAEGRHPVSRRVKVSYGHEIESHIDEILAQPRFEKMVDGLYPRRWVAVKLLENDGELLKTLGGDREEFRDVFDRAESIRRHLRDLYNEAPEMVITESRYGFVSGALRQFYRPPARDRVSLSDLADQILTHKILGLPVFLLMIWAMFQATFTLGAYPMDLIDAGVTRFGGFVGELMGEGFFRDLVVDGAINGVGFVIVFLPNILILFFCISLIEDSGYMARAAFLMDRVMRSVGLHGKAFIPMLMGFGCNVPAVMGTRTLETERDRLLSILVNPLMSCSARLPVYILLAGTFFGAKTAGTVIFALYAMGIVLAIAMAKLFSQTILKGDASPFVMELPPYRMPTLKSSMIHMWDRGKIFLKKMGGVILVGSVTIWVLTAYPKDFPEKGEHLQRIAGLEQRIAVLAPEAPAEAVAALKEQRDAAFSAMESERIAGSYIGRIGQGLEPIFRPMGFDWKSCVAILSGFVAKEIVVSTYSVLYQAGRDADEKSHGLQAALKASPLTPLRAFALMAFILIYTPCLGTLAAIKRETNSWKWTAFSVGYSLVLAWGVSFSIVSIGSLLGYS